MQRAPARLLHRRKQRRLSEALHGITPRIDSLLGDARALRSFLPARHEHTCRAVASGQNSACWRSSRACVERRVSTVRAEIFSRRKHSAANQLCAAVPSNFVAPIHPGVLADAQKLPCFVIRRKAQVVHAPQRRARSIPRPIERRFARQRKIRDPLRQPWPKVRPPRKLGHLFRLHRRNPALALQNFLRSPIDFPTHIERHLLFRAHVGPPPCRSRWVGAHDATAPEAASSGEADGTSVREGVVFLRDRARSTRKELCSARRESWSKLESSELFRCARPKKRK